MRVGSVGSRLPTGWRACSFFAKSSRVVFCVTVKRMVSGLKSVLHDPGVLVQEVEGLEHGAENVF